MSINLKSMTQQEIGAVLKEMGQPAFRAKQVYTWLHKGVRSYDEMSNLPKSLRDALARHLTGPAENIRRAVAETRRAIHDRHPVWGTRRIPVDSPAPSVGAFSLGSESY